MRTRSNTASFELTPPNEVEMARQMEHLLDSNFPYLTAETDGVCCGYAFAGPYRARPAYFRLYRARYASPRHEARTAGRADRNLARAWLSADGCGDRRLNQTGGVGWPTRGPRLPPCQHFAGCRIPTRAAGSIASLCSVRWDPAQRTDLIGQFATSARDRSIARNTRSSSWPRRTIRPVAEITLYVP